MWGFWAQKTRLKFGLTAVGFPEENAPSPDRCQAADRADVELGQTTETESMQDGWKFWVDVVIAIGTLAAVVVALFGEWLRARMFSPKLTLTLASPRGDPTPVTVLSMFCTDLLACHGLCISPPLTPNQH
jgi:hypothetical protein